MPKTRSSELCHYSCFCYHWIMLLNKGKVKIIPFEEGCCVSELYLCELNKLKSIKSVCWENASQLPNCTTSASGPKFDSLPNCHQKWASISTCYTATAWAQLMKEASCILGPHTGTPLPRRTQLPGSSGMRALGQNSLSPLESSVWPLYQVTWRKHLT